MMVKLLIIFVILSLSLCSTTANPNSTIDWRFPPHTLQLLGQKSNDGAFAEIKAYLLPTALLLLAALVKLVYEWIPYIPKYIPESCVLLCGGVLFGAAFYHYLEIDSAQILSKQYFFFLLLPPIILESAYELHDEEFVRNFMAILLFAIVGTLINIFGVSGCMYLIAPKAVRHIDYLEILLFSVIVSAVDPVAVLSIFNELRVNKSLYFIVFGESLFNDAVVITIYYVILGNLKTQETNVGIALVHGVAKFSIVFLGGAIVGMVLGMVTLIISRFTRRAIITEPLLFIAFAYIAYLIAEVFHFSGIISMVTCGLLQSGYGRYNIDPKSETTIGMFIKIVAKFSELLIFLFLGNMIVVHTHEWRGLFVLAAVVFTLFWRIVSVAFCSWIANVFFIPSRPINMVEKVVMAFGGLRGAIAFSLANQLKDMMTNANLFITTTLFIVVWSVFVYGIGTKPLVNTLRVERQKDKKHDGLGWVIDRINLLIIPLIEEVENKSQVHRWMRRLNAVHTAFIQWFVVGGQDTVTAQRRKTVAHEAAAGNEKDDSAKKKKPGFHPDDRFDPSILDDPEVVKMIQQTRAVSYHDFPITLDLVGVERIRRLPNGTTQRWDGAVEFAKANEHKVEPVVVKPTSYSSPDLQTNATIQSKKSKKSPKQVKSTLPVQYYQNLHKALQEDPDEHNDLRSRNSNY